MRCCDVKVHRLGFGAIAGFEFEGGEIETKDEQCSQSRLMSPVRRRHWHPTHPTAPAKGETFVYRQICDASAAVAIDADRFVVADDERNVLRIYQRDLANPLVEPIFLGIRGKRGRRSTSQPVFQKWKTG
jgi:hypothetical protein